MIMNTDIEAARKAITENWGDSGNKKFLQLLLLMGLLKIFSTIV